MNEPGYHKKQVSDRAPAEIQEQIPIDLCKNKKRNDLSIHIASFMKNQPAQLNTLKPHISTINFTPQGL